MEGKINTLYNENILCFESRLLALKKDPENEPKMSVFRCKSRHSIGFIKIILPRSLVDELIEFFLGNSKQQSRKERDKIQRYKAWCA